MTIPPDKLPDPWLYDSACLLRDLDIVREKILEIPLHPDTYTPTNIALSTVWNIREKLQYLIGLHAAMQRDWKARATESKAPATAIPTPSEANTSRQRHVGRAKRASVT
jgi:hypothetical protein